LAKDDSVRDDLDPPGRFDRQHLPLLFGQYFELGCDLIRQCSEVDSLQTQPDGIGVGTTQNEKSIDEARQPIGLLEHAADDVPISVVVAMTPQANLPDTPDGGKRGAQLMGRISGEPPQLCERPLEPRQRIVEDDRQLAELALRVVYG
jgi:hypothetical protein